jgi:hypothetical protein
MSTNLYTVQELAGMLGMAPTQVYNELESFPHLKTTDPGIVRFAEEHVSEIRAIRAASPTKQLERYQRILDRREQILALGGVEDEVAN